MRFLIICTNERWKDGDEPFRAVGAGLERLGHSAEPVALARTWPLCPGRPDGVFFWNCIHGIRGRIAARFRAQGVPLFVMERGFFRRFDYCQIDHAGFNHTASWAASLGRSAPQEGLQRFLAAWGRARTPVAQRGHGLLILGQCPRDSQLHEAALQTPQALVMEVLEAAPPDIPIYFRPHPESAWRPSHGCTITAAGPLWADLQLARFAVTVNSNAGNEALAYGCPVMALGPALYTKAGVAYHATVDGLTGAIEAMWAGWLPTDAAVANYLYHLACRQYSNAELEEGTVLQRILEAA